MLSRSAIVKLKAILIIDLLIVGAAAGVYFYFQDQGIITSGSPRPADFTLSNLIVNPTEVYVGEAVQISVNLTNSGDLEGNITMDFLINSAIRDSENLTLAGNSSQIVEFTDVETAEGSYLVQVGNLNCTFILKPAPPETSKIVLSSVKVDPYEVWANESVTVTAIAENPSTDTEKLTVKISVDDTMVESQIIEMEPKASQTVTFVINGTYAEGRHELKLNTLKGSFTVVKYGYHTLTVNRSGGGSTPLPITLNGVVHNTPYIALLPVGTYSVSVPTPFSVGTGVLDFTYWSDGSRSASRTFDLEGRLILVCTYTLVSGYACCPSLYIWNGTGYSYVTEVSNPGWLGYIGYINPNGNIVFSGGNPWDYVKLDSNQLATKDGYFNMALFQQWDELFYIDSAYMLVVDHPVGTNVYTSMTNYLNKGSTGQIYTVGQNLLVPVSAINEKGESVLDQIRYKDGNFTPGINGNASPAWNNVTLNQLTLNLGNLSAAQQIKLVMTGMVDWGPADTYYNWINSFKTAAAQGLITQNTPITPDPYMEVRLANGSWTRVAQDRQIPIPSDYNARTFTLDLTGLFPQGTSDYQVRLTNFWNVTYDYIGIDTTPQENITIQRINPSSATLSQIWDTQSTSSGAFTRYGDVLPLVQNADDMYVVGRQGDQVDLQFSAGNLSEPAPGMVRDYFFVVASWFKDPPEAWGYGFDFTTDPMPFMAMTGFPYTDAESYPYDAAHIAYIAEYNTRIIP